MAANGGTEVNNSSVFSGGSNTRKGRLIMRYRQLDKAFEPWRSHYQELSDHSQPRRGTYLRQRNSRGSGYSGRIRNNKIIDNKATMAIRTLVAGFMSGLMSPARPWFRLRFSGDALTRDDDAKNWLQDSTRVMQEQLAKSNFYSVAANVITDLAIFGTAAMYRQHNITHPNLVFRCFSAGEYRIAEDDKGDVNTIAREFMMTTAQIVDRFIIYNQKGDMDWSKCSRRVKDAYMQNQLDTEFSVVHVIQPRRKRNKKSPMQANMKFESVYFELGSDTHNDDKLLYDGGYENFPCYIPRWRKNADDVYGESPLMDALGDCKQLQQQHRRKAQAIEKNVNPPYVADVSLKNRPTSSLPGGITYVSGDNVGNKIMPIHTPNPYIRELSDDMKEVQMRIGMALYEPLFAQFAYNDTYGDKMTAEEVMKRDAERLVLLTPTLQNIGRALLSPLIKDVFVWSIHKGIIAEPPPQVEDLMATSKSPMMHIEYVSPLAQAQEAVYANVVERVVSFVGNLAQLYPGGLDNIDMDVAIRKYIRSLGFDEDAIRGSRDVMKLREQRIQEQQQAEVKDAVLGGGAESAANAAKTLHEIDQTGGSALDTNYIPAQGQI